MNAIIQAKRDQAATWLSSIDLPSDWRAERLATAKDWLLENGAPHRRDHYWSYTDPKLWDGEIGSDTNIQLPEFQSDLGNDVVVTPLDRAEFTDFGRLVHAAHEFGARPMAELNLLQAKGIHVKVTGEGGRLVINRDEWDAPFYMAIDMAPGASLTVIETGQNSGRHSAVMECFLDDGAVMDHLRISPARNDLYHAHIFAELKSQADFRSFGLNGASQFRRFETVASLIGDGAQFSVAGANLLTGSAHHDDTVYVTHDALDCTSRQVFKRVVDEGATSVFQGKILVKEGAQKTDGYQISQGLMLAAGAEVLSKPELEIYADDVACSHGSTTSGMDETSLFYLQSRGVPRAQAEKLLVRAFIDEALEEIRDDALRAQFAALSEQWIFGRIL